MKFLLLFIFAIISYSAYCQTFHAIIFSNMNESRQRAADRTEEMRNMKDFCEKISTSLGYEQDIRCHSDIEFTSEQFLHDISSIDVCQDDIVMMFYNGHGCNWDDDDWPHMCFKDKQYWQTLAFNQLKEKCNNAKLLLCIGCCCNMDSRGQENFDLGFEYNLDPNKTRALFAGFNGKKRIVTSSSIRGQYSYSWTSGNRLGSIYGISLRAAINEILSPSSNITPTWENAFNLAKEKTMYYTSSHKEGPQTPQYKIDDIEETLSPRANKILNEMMGMTINNYKTTEASVISTSLKKNIDVVGIPSLVIDVDFDICNLSSDGCKVVAFIETPKGVGVNDTNGRYCTSDGKVCVGKDFGTRQEKASYKDFHLIIPMDELHLVDSSKTYYVRVGIYDYRSTKFISFGKYKKLKLF